MAVREDGRHPVLQLSWDIPFPRLPPYCMASVMSNAPAAAGFAQETVRNEGRFPLIRRGLWNPLQDIFCPLIITWKSLCRKILRTIAKKPLCPWKKKPSLAFSAASCILSVLAIYILKAARCNMEGCSWQGDPGGWRVKKVAFLAVSFLPVDGGKGNSLLIPNTCNGRKRLQRFLKSMYIRTSGK